MQFNFQKWSDIKAVLGGKWRKEEENWYWIYWANSFSNNSEHAIDFKLSDVQQEDEEDIRKANFIDSFQKQADSENSLKM